ncbi:hypothetical protein GAYE_SCF16G3707 [Galdieria yellowstonensis]|jgi:T-complex protein 1 subunit alpha|uniref:T-complex protein 1 subunit alpha n=1 Tax=Galdieria yellowstonensis TaxID=3028027 RepID=A0AAV9IEJ9_9RHOD|nr:hypothetical protein GAYE_SCF16G3707 [Galdieria yellowstonensis]
MSSLAIYGERQSGEDVRTQNITACVAIANILRSSLGPVGLDKMLVDDMGDVTVTNDGATILKQLEVEHPAAKVLVELAQQQDEEVGDGTTSVVLLAAELLKRADDLVRRGIHPTNVIAGYRLAMRESCKYLRDTLSVSVEKLGRSCLINTAKTAISSKVIGSEIDFFANLAVEAVLAVKRKTEDGKYKYPIKAINILKKSGKGVRDSQLLKGIGLNVTRASQGMPLRVSPAKIACLDFDLRRSKMKMGVQVLVEDPKELEKIQEKEYEVTKSRIEAILKAGANAIFTTKGIDDAALKYFVEKNAIAVRRVDKDDMKRLAKATGASVQLTMADLGGEESFDPSFLGSAEEVVEETIADDKFIFVRGCKNLPSGTVVLRGPNEYMCDEMSRSLHDCLCAVQRALESNYVVAGGGCVEASLSIFLENFATTLGGREQLAIAEFSDALLVIPKTLAANAALDATEMISKLRAVHNAAQSDSNKGNLSHMGLDLENGLLRDNLEAGILEPAMSKIKSIQLATEAAITILRIDDLIKLKKKQEEESGEY